MDNAGSGNKKEAGEEASARTQRTTADGPKLSFTGRVRPAAPTEGGD